MSLFKQLERQLADLQKPQTLHDLHNIAGRAVYDLVMEGFAEQHDPYGRGWKPTKRRNPILHDTGALQSGIKWKADSRGVIIRTTGKANAYAAYQQYGTPPSTRYAGGNGRFISAKKAARYKRKMAYLVDVPGLPARPFLPEGNALPPAYEQRLQNDFRQYFRDKYGGR